VLAIAELTPSAVALAMNSRRLIPRCVSSQLRYASDIGIPPLLVCRTGSASVRVLAARSRWGALPKTIGQSNR
jgi:hypothetical protein